ncbi:formylglycine-generating enzyme family protein [Chitinophaga sp. sic0106]|uniref:formylglycine-generating enzyme family protein n=1 Tax=Chitinophaga sp. sic0106 TaxID=2854785 RepID=UPI002106ED7D|nr:formylglycine-generating enzyme family protein [Chitinophaga sp. sic0106]
MLQRYFLLIPALACLYACDHSQATSTTKAITTAAISAADAVKGMVLVKGDVFMMGTDDPKSYLAERPAHQVKVHDFYIDATEVTNRQFKKFVDATGYKTVAERKPKWEDLKQQLPPGTAQIPDDELVPGSMVFVAPDRPVNKANISNWWQWVPGADWQHPEGPGSNIEGRWDHPVVHVAWEDANAYAKWAGKRLPTEAEWEYAARGGLVEKRYAWGDDFTPGNKYMANTFQGSFPDKNDQADGYAITAPVASYPANGYGLYDMIGNVWEWTADWYDVDEYKSLAHQLSEDPKGPDKWHNPEDPYAIQRVTKGGSFLCANDYCINYRPSARRGTAFDSGASHIGFRCVKDKK